MIDDLNIAKALIEAFDNDETGILLYDQQDNLCFANKPMFTRFNRLNVNYELGENIYDRMRKFKKLKILPNEEIDKRIKNYEKADKDLIDALQITPDDAYILNYLAYSWLERDYKINEAIKMLETAYELESNDPYIIDSIGWAYYLTNDYPRAEKFLKRAVELMPDDPIVNDHYGDILWKLNRKIQARYFWTNVLKMKDTEKELIEKINIKMIEGLKSS